MNTFQLFKTQAWIFPTLIFTFLVFLGANMHPLWGDEAETALFARNILKCGVPCGWDGVNIMGINDAVVLNKDLINHTSPWAQYYLAAASFKIFGESSFTARLPFIFLAVASVPILYSLALKITEDKKTAFLTIFIASVSVPYILFAYQARYFSLISLASLMLVFSCLNLLEQRKWPKILFVISGTLFFYGNYVIFVAFYIAAFFSFLIYLFSKRARLKDIKKFVMNFAVLSFFIFILTVPWYILMGPFETRGEIVNLPLGLFLHDLWIFLQEAFSLYNLNNGLPILFIPPLIFVLIRAIKRKRSILLLIQLLIPTIFLLTMSIFTVVANVDTKFNETRYTMIIFPYLIMAIATLIKQIWHWNKPIAYVTLMVYLLSNIFTLQPFRSFPWEFAHEVVNFYPTPDKVVADFLEKNAKDNDTAFVNLDRNHEPLIFHLGDKIRFINRVSSTNTRIFPKSRKIIPRYIYDFRGKPDWIILYSKREQDVGPLVFDMRSLPPEVGSLQDYEEIVLPVFFSDLSRPEMYLRSFSELEPSYEDQVFIYKKKIDIDY